MAESRKDDCGCPLPPETVFKKNNLTIEGFNSSFGSATATLAKLQTNADVENLASQAALDNALMDYARCRAISCEPKMSAETWAYFERMARFATAKPTAAEWIEWYKLNPAINGDTIKRIGEASPTTSTLEKPAVENVRASSAENGGSVFVMRLVRDEAKASELGKSPDSTRVFDITIGNSTDKTIVFENFMTRAMYQKGALASVDGSPIIRPDAGYLVPIPIDIDKDAGMWKSVTQAIEPGIILRPGTLNDPTRVTIRVCFAIQLVGRMTWHPSSDWGMLYSFEMKHADGSLSVFSDRSWKRDRDKDY